MNNKKMILSCSTMGILQDAIYDCLGANFEIFNNSQIINTRTNEILPFWQVEHSDRWRVVEYGEKHLLTFRIYKKKSGYDFLVKDTDAIRNWIIAHHVENPTLTPKQFIEYLNDNFTINLFLSGVLIDTGALGDWWKNRKEKIFYK